MRSYWKHISTIGLTDQIPPDAAKRLQLVNRVSIVGALIFIPSLFRYMSLEEHLAAIFQALTLVGMFAVMGLNALHRYTLARYAVIMIGNLNVVMTSSVFGYDSGEHLAFLVIVLFATLMYHPRREWHHLLINVAGTFSCFILLIVTDFHVIETSAHNFAAETQYHSHLFNMGVTIIFGVLIGYYFQQFSQGEVQRIAERGRRQLRAAFDHSQSGIMLIEADNFLLIEWNKRAGDLLGFDSSQLLPNQSLAEVPMRRIAPREIIDAVDIVRRQQHPGELSFSYRSQVYWLLMEVENFQYEGRQLLHIQLSDITEKKRYEQKLIRAKEMAESATIAKAHFLSNMSHEFRTPINGILGMTELLEIDYEDDDQLQEYVSILRVSGERLLRTVSLILDLSHLESGKHQLSPSLLDVAVLLHERWQHAQIEPDNPDLCFELDLPDTPIEAYLDPILLKMAVDHLLSNAIKFTPHGKVRLSLRAVSTEQPAFEIEVEDTGIGMSEYFIQHKLFRKFEQESEGLDRVYEGAGLGLSITRRITEMMGGTISVESQQGAGTKFRLGFPYRPDLLMQLDNIASGQTITS